jgi:hypothetical protein
LAEIACGDFSGHYSVARWQKAWFLPAAPEAMSADITAQAAGKKRGFCLLFNWLEVACGASSGHYSVARGQKAWFLPAAPAGVSRWSALVEFVPNDTWLAKTTLFASRQENRRAQFCRNRLRRFLPIN